MCFEMQSPMQCFSIFFKLQTIARNRYFHHNSWCIHIHTYITETQISQNNIHPNYLQFYIFHLTLFYSILSCFIKKLLVLTELISKPNAWERGNCGLTNMGLFNNLLSRTWCIYLSFQAHISCESGSGEPEVSL